MKKKSKSRVSQETRPWLRLADVSDVFSVPTKMVTRWVAGGHRDWETKVLSSAIAVEYNKLFLKSFLNISEEISETEENTEKIKNVEDESDDEYDVEEKIKNVEDESDDEYDVEDESDDEYETGNSEDVIEPLDELLKWKLARRLHTFNKIGSSSKHKNYCTILGRGRTFDRTLYMARHSTRKLAGVGLISGLIK